MSTIEGILEQLEAVQADLNKIKDDLGRLGNQQTSFGGDLLTGLDLLSSESLIIPPSEDSVEEVVGGFMTEDFPDCCAVGDNTEFFCSGTLIAPKAVVTAAHCTDVSRVFLKGNDVLDPESGEIIQVIEEYIHPAEDLRILILEKESSVSPRHIAQGVEVGSPSIGKVVGFGTVNLAGTVGYGIKRMVEVPITTINCCDESDVSEFGCRMGREIVAGHRGLIRDSCSGDSGGPMYIKNKYGEYDLLGATSRGASNSTVPCGDGGIYVRVDLCLDWIQEVTGIEIEGPRLLK